jgi:hypothetical protein
MDTESFRSDLSKALDGFPYESCVDNQVAFYDETVKNVLDRHCPLNTRTHAFKRNPPWYTKDIHLARRTRRRLERSWRKSGSIEDRKNYVDQIHNLSKLIRHEKSKYFIAKLKSADTKTVFRTLGTLLNHSAPTLPSCESMKSLSNRFCNFFIEKIILIRQKIVSSLTGSEQRTGESCLGDHAHPPLVDFALLSEDEVAGLVGKSPNKTCGLDPIPTWLLKENVDIMLPALTTIVNTSLSSGSFPSSLKDAIVTPILKKNGLDCNNLKNYRPVSNTAFLSKLIEKSAMSCVNNHVLNNNLAQEFQSAYRSGHSTETALLRVKSDILNAVDDRQAVFLVLLDLSAAFDTIDHNIMLNRLSNDFGISGHVRHFFKSYLCNRTNRVKVAGEISDKQTLNFGLPQGSVIGPQFFSFYTHPIADIIKCYEHVKYHFYADDTQLYISFDPRNQSDLDNALRTLTSCITDIKYWMNHNMLQLNESKTEFYIISTSHFVNQLSDVTLNIGSEDIKPSSTIKNLGVVFDKTLTMTNQVSSICSSISLHLRHLSRIRMFIDQSTCQDAVRAIISSRLDYANSLLYGINDKDLKRLQRQQNRAAKLIFKARKYDHATPFLRDLHWLPIHARIHFKLLTIVFKCFMNSDNLPSYIRDLIKPYTPSRSGLRSAQDTRLAIIPRTRLATGDKGFYAAGPSLWNQLPSHIRHAPSLATFKSQLKTYLFDM